MSALEIRRIPGLEEFDDPGMFLAGPKAEHLTGGLLIYDGGMAFPGA